METIKTRICRECGGKLALRCGLCHKKRTQCRNEYCTGESELCCLNCKKTYINGNPLGEASGEIEDERS